MKRIIHPLIVGVAIVGVTGLSIPSAIRAGAISGTIDPNNISVTHNPGCYQIALQYNSNSIDLIITR